MQHFNFGSDFLLTNTANLIFGKVEQLNATLAWNLACDWEAFQIWRLPKMELGNPQLRRVQQCKQGLQWPLQLPWMKVNKISEAYQGKGANLIPLLSGAGGKCTLWPLDA